MQYDFIEYSILKISVEVHLSRSKIFHRVFTKQMISIIEKNTSAKVRLINPKQTSL